MGETVPAFSGMLVRVGVSTRVMGVESVVGVRGTSDAASRGMGTKDARGVEEVGRAITEL
jgi:hypothetical protein